MARKLHIFDRPQRFIAGTVGEPGERVFYLQASDGGHTVSVALEKEQVRILAERVDDVIDEVTRRGEVAPIEAPAGDLGPLEMPLMEEFRVAALGLAWDDTDNVLVIEAVSGSSGEVQESGIFSDDDDAPDAIRVKLEAVQAKAFATRAAALVESGRPPCPLCSQPLGRDGHICPRQNGYHRATLA